MRSRFVRPDSVVIPISDGDTITVKRRLDHGEEHEKHARLYYVEPEEGRLRVDPLRVPMAPETAYLLDWSIGDEQGKVEIRGLAPEALERVLDKLDPEAFAEIGRAIAQHEGAQAEARAQEKKRQG